MGSGASLAWSIDEDSVKDGKKVCKSDPIEEYDMDVFIDTIEEKIRYPVPPFKEGVLKSCEVEDHCPGEFTVKVVLDGAKLDRYGFGKGDGTDRVDMWSRLKIDRANRSFANHIMVGPQGAWIDEVDPALPVVAIHYTYIVDGFMESYIEVVKDGTRVTDDNCKAAVEGFFNGVLNAMVSRKVKVYNDRPSPSGSQKSIVSDAIEEHLDYETFFNNLIQCIKEPPGVTPEVVEVSETEFEVHTEPPAAQGEKFVNKVTFDKDSGDITTATFAQSGRIFGWVIKLHKEPSVIFEAAILDDQNERTCGPGAKQVFQGLVDAALAKGSGGWFF